MELNTSLCTGIQAEVCWTICLSVVFKIKFLTLLLLDTFMYWTDLTKTIVEIMYKTGKMLVTILCWLLYIFVHITCINHAVPWTKNMNSAVFWSMLAYSWILLDYIHFYWMWQWPALAYVVDSICHIKVHAELCCWDTVEFSFEILSSLFLSVIGTIHFTVHIGCNSYKYVY